MAEPGPRLRQYLESSGPDSVDSGQCWSVSAAFGPTLADSWPNLAEVGPHAVILVPHLVWATLVRFGSSLSNTWTKFNRIRPVWPQSRRKSLRMRPNLTDVDQSWPDLGKHRPAFQDIARPPSWNNLSGNVASTSWVGCPSRPHARSRTRRCVRAGCVAMPRRSQASSGTPAWRRARAHPTWGLRL